MTPLRILALASLLALLPAVGTGGWLEIPGIQGESTDRAYEGWIDIESVSLGTDRAGAGAATGAAAARGAENSGAGHLTIVKHVDKSSAAIAQAAASGKHFPTVTIVSRKDHFVLTNVLISSVQHMGGSAGDELPKETITFNYGALKISYTPQTADKSSAATATMAAPAGMAAPTKIMTPATGAAPATGMRAAAPAPAAPMATVPPLSPRAVTLDGQLLPALSPVARTWVTTEARSLLARGLSPSAMTGVARQDANTRFAPAHLSPRDIDTLVFLVLMEGAKQNEQEMQMKMQMAMERRSQFEEALSNIMRTMNETASDVVRNIK